ncbi:hypothetical protein PG989_010036 [Apiospora arundinis]
MSYMDDILELYFANDNIPHAPQGGMEDGSESLEVKLIPELDLRDLPQTLQIANRLDHTVLDSWESNLERLPDLRGIQWDYKRCHLENTFDVRLPPNSMIAWIAAQAAMGMKGMRFASRKSALLPDPLGMVILGRTDCGMALEFDSAKSLRCPLDGVYSPPYGLEEPCDLAGLFQRLVRQLHFQKGSPTKFAGLPDSWLGWHPLFWPTGILKHIMVPKVLNLISVNLGILVKQKRGHVSVLPMLQFISEIMWRCCYIIESYRAMSPGKGLSLNLLGASIQDLTKVAQEGRCYWPWLGPNVELDIFIFEQGIIEEKEPFDVRTSYLVRMYGMGIRDLRFLQRNPNEGEKRAQLETLHRCHTLRAWLGEEESADLAEQLEFCYFSMAASKANKDPKRSWSTGSGAETEQTHGRRGTPILLRRKFNDAGQLIREGDWHLLDPGHKCVLLGGPSRYHQEHKEHARLLQQWPAPHFHYHEDNNGSLILNENIHFPPDSASFSDPYAILPPRLSAPSGLHFRRGGTAYLTLSERLKGFTRDFEDRLYFAPEGLEKFVEIHDFAVLEKPPTNPLLGTDLLPSPEGDVPEHEEDSDGGDIDPEDLPESVRVTLEHLRLL